MALQKQQFACSALRSASGDQRERKDYRKMADIKLPRPERVRGKAEGALYPVEVTESEGGRVKIHYIGYSDRHDKWRQEEELQDWESEQGVEQYQAFDLHQELKYRTKVALKAGTRNDPVVRVEVLFDPLIFNGGLRQAGHLIRRERGHKVYGISCYTDLTPFLGSRWHIRVLNPERFLLCKS